MTSISSDTASPSHTAILQFGTSRFLLAHADLFVSEALQRGEAVGTITLVQTTGNAESAKRVAALSSGQAYPVRVRGLSGGDTVDVTVEGRAIGKALSAQTDWPAVREAALAARIILSNTGDRGFDLDSIDTAASVADRSIAPKSFPAKITTLLLERFEQCPDDPISIYPCELISRNGDKLRSLVLELATAWNLPPEFNAYIDRSCCFANSLVDRIVSEPIEPVGAVAEPYALWAIEEQAGLTLPCTHPAIIVTDDLARYEELKLHILNLGHTVLAELWLSGANARAGTVLEIMNDDSSRETLERVWCDEVVPVFAANGQGAEAASYVDEVRERFLNPFLAHRLADIAGNHTEKKRRRLLPVIERGRLLERPIPQPILSAMMEANHD